MIDQLKISFDNSKTIENTDCLPYIGIFGRKNYGKSSFVNALAGLDLAEVSKISGTTKEPAKYIAELDSIGNVVLFDTSGIDDYGESGEKRILKTLDILKRIDFAVLIITGSLFAESEKKLVSKFSEFSIPFVVVHNKSDLQELSQITKGQVETAYQTKIVEFSCENRRNINELIAVLKNMIPETAFQSKSILGDVVKKNDLVILAAVDDFNSTEEILTRSQIEITSDLLGNSCTSLLVKYKDLHSVLKKLQPPPKLIILPTSTFKNAEDSLPGDMQLTTYGIVMARYKGDFINYVKDTPKIQSLNEGDRILILQASADSTSPEFKVQEELQHLMTEFCGKTFDYTIVNIFEKPIVNLNKYNYAVICGSYLLTKKQISANIQPIADINIPVTSFEMINAFVRGVFARSIAPFIL